MYGVRVGKAEGQGKDRELTPRYQFAVAPLFRSLVTSIALARFVLQDELVPQFTAATLMGRTSPINWVC